jgi:hypothetical protein
MKFSLIVKFRFLAMREFGPHFCMDSANLTGGGTGGGVKNRQRRCLRKHLEPCDDLSVHQFEDIGIFQASPSGEVGAAPQEVADLVCAHA